MPKYLQCDLHVEVTGSTRASLAEMSPTFRAQLEESEIPYECNSQNKGAGFTLRQFPASMLEWLADYCDRVGWRLWTYNHGSPDSAEFWRLVYRQVIEADQKTIG